MQRFRKILSEASQREQSSLRFGAFIERKKSALIA